MKEKFVKKDVPRAIVLKIEYFFRSAESLQIRFDPIIACFSNHGKTKYCISLNNVPP